MVRPQNKSRVAEPARRNEAIRTGDASSVVEAAYGSGKTCRRPVTVRYPGGDEISGEDRELGAPARGSGRGGMLSAGRCGRTTARLRSSSSNKGGSGDCGLSDSGRCGVPGTTCSAEAFAADIERCGANCARSTCRRMPTSGSRPSRHNGTRYPQTRRIPTHHRASGGRTDEIYDLVALGRRWRSSSAGSDSGPHVRSAALRRRAMRWRALLRFPRFRAAAEAFWSQSLRQAADPGWCVIPAPGHRNSDLDLRIKT